MPFDNLLHISVQKDWVDYLSALLTPTVALFGLYIGYRQWRTEEAKLRHELFERRYKQFDAVTKFVFSAISLSPEVNQSYATYEEEDILWSEISGIQFIFSPEIKDHVDTHIIYPYEEIQELRVKFHWMKNKENCQQNVDCQREIKDNLRKNLQTFQEKAFKYMQIQQPSLLKKIWRHLADLWEKIQKAAEE